MDPVDAFAGLVIAVGLVGIVVPVLPGTLLVAGAVLAWAVATGTGEGWAYAGAATAILVVGTVVKYVLPGRRLRASGVPTRAVVLGGLLGIVGFFVVPVVGLFVGFVLGVYLVEVSRVGVRDATPTTVAALKAVGLSILVELAAALLATTAWAAGVVAT
jgi:uncharacterized protein YqgC (DUF456 family)